jgi:coproporphyrinogen III oxidase
MERGWLLGENGGDVWQVWKVPSTFDVWWFFGGYDLGRYVPFQQALGKKNAYHEISHKVGPPR